jgi:hypothetical protein
LFFKTGILFSSISDDSLKSDIGILPIQFEYIYPHKIISPKVALGINFYYAKDWGQNNYSIALMGGLNVRLYKSFYWTLKYDLDFIPSKKLLIIPALSPPKTMAQSISTGFYFEL